jgi:hypothetical protein
MPTVVVSGAIANKYLNGGEAWVRLSWVLGLRRLGCDVHFVEQIDRDTCVGEDGEATDFEHSANLSYFRDVVGRFGIASSATLVYERGERTSGLPYEELIEIARSADLLVNISGHLDLEQLMQEFRTKAYVDLDPGFTQLWHAAGNPGARLAGHDLFFTVAESINAPHTRIPTGGIEWKVVRPPVVLDEWPVCEQGEHDRFTTVASWRGPFGPIEHEGQTYGLKVHEFRKFIELPKLSPCAFEIALDIHPGDSKDREVLVANGWRIRAPRDVVQGPQQFRDYVQWSGAEFSVAQGIYVATRMGWFSDRTVRYLASGKPALVQDTGFSDNYPTGKGLVSFATMEEAVAGANSIARDYASHSRAARSIAEAFFDSDVVLGRFLEQAGTKYHRLPK